MEKTTIYRRPMCKYLFEEELTIDALSEMGNPLERLYKRVDIEMFRPILEGTLLTKKVKNAAGNKPRDVVLMRCLVKHIFGFVKGAMNGLFMRSIGMMRAKASTAITCLVYNIFRYEQLCRCQPAIVEKD